MASLAELVKKGIFNPGQILPYLKRKTGISPWGTRGPLVKAAEFRHKHRRHTKSPTSIWEKEWDLLVVLDACRPEWMVEVQDDVEFVDDIDTIHSVGSHSAEWIANTFDKEYADELENCVYVTGNHYADGLEESRLAAFETAHDYGSWAYDSASPPANVVTDLAVQTARKAEWERCIVHYMQPHKPFITPTGERGEISVQEWSLAYRPYQKYFDGEITKDELQSGFVSNLKYVLEEVKMLLENVDAPTAVLTSDHGQALGDGGLWDHTIGVKHPSMRRVPWVETTATDEETLDPDEYTLTDYDEKTVEENLRMLGYR